MVVKNYKMSVLFLYAHQKQRANIWVSTEQMEWLMNGTNEIDSMSVIHVVWNEANQKAEQIRLICKIMCFVWVWRHVITENTVFSKVQHLKPEKGYRFFLLVHFFPVVFSFLYWICFTHFLCEFANRHQMRLNMKNYLFSSFVSTFFSPTKTSVRGKRKR